MVSEKATLVNPQGLHMRPAGLFASTMGKYACDVTVVTPEKEVNGKSPMALMAAGIPCGTEVEVKCDGADEAEALAAAIGGQQARTHGGTGQHDTARAVKFQGRAA